ncbi:uncharacterized protein LTR77_003804 [Saxophila tyrrhenica]|uniref:Metallo-beta-lactamase domain-containing protein n=1 Tax=Saxophila tyrrhenica TaxID=1690608 RepID=A0AAV9PHL0_9PEZI|nr:hypothetical protein LTR77_003804 [Saxophila tyrrhenica]
MVGHPDLPICTACGTQFDLPSSGSLKSCRICDDPRQFVPAAGQSWTTLSDLQSSHKNTWTQDTVDSRIWSISTEPKFGIGQRCILLQTSSGNVLWDCIALLDDETVERIKGMGGLKVIVISHPHYYTTHLDWAGAFGCPVYLAKEDVEWCCREDREGRRKLIEGDRETVEGMGGVVAAKPGGHFPGSLVLAWEKKLFIADTMVTTPSAYYHVDRQPGTISYAFMWSIPNMIPLPPSELIKMWQVLKTLNFESTYAAFVGTEIRDKNVKGRVLESMKIQARNEGYNEHEILNQKWPE